MDKYTGNLYTAPRIISLSHLSLATDVTDGTLGASDLWLGTRTGAGGTATLTESFVGRSPWLHKQQLGSVLQFRHSTDVFIYYSASSCGAGFLTLLHFYLVDL